MSQNQQSVTNLDERFPQEGDREKFIKEQLKSLKRRPWIIADRRLKGCYGTFDGKPHQVSWRSREAQRYITERYRKRELFWVKVGIFFAIVIGLFALVAAILAMPTENSLLSNLTCWLSGKLCGAVLPAR